MTGKEKIEAAFSEDGAREFAAVVPYEDIYIRDNWSKLTSHPWWWRHEPRLDRQLAWRSDVVSVLGQDWFNVATCKSREDRERMRVETSADEAFLVDDRTGNRRHLEPPTVSGWTDPAGATIRPESLPENEDDVDRLIAAVENEPGPLTITDGSDDLAKAVLAGIGKDLFPISRVGSPLWGLYSIWGYEGLMMMVASRPDLVKRACDRVYSRVLRRARECAALGSRAVWIEECLTDQISPEAFKKLNVPILTKLVDAIHGLDMKAIYYFCGDPKDKWEHILSVGADALSLEESKKGFTVDIAEVVEIVRGRCVLLGNIDAIGVLQNGTEEQLRAAVEHQIEAGRANGGWFIVSLGSPIPPGTPPSRVRRYCELAHDLSSRGG